MSKKKIKILFSIPNFDTAGSGKVVYDLVRTIDKKVFEPHIACFHNRGAFFEKISDLNIPIHILEFAISYKPLFSFPFRLLKIRRFFKKHDFDLIHSWHWSSDFSEPLAARMSCIPFVYTKKNMGWGNKAWKWRSRLAQRIIPLNAKMKSEFFKNYSNKLVDIPIGVDLNKFSSSYDRENIRKEKIELITIANVLEIKGIDILCEAVNELIENENFDINLNIIGAYSTPYGTALKNKFESTNILFLGKKGDVHSILQSSSIFVLASRAKGEGQPMALIEAMACGVLSIGTKVPGIEDVLNKFAKCLCKPENINSLKVLIKEFIKMDAKDYNRICKDQQHYIMNKYDLTEVIKKYEELYKEMTK